MKHKMAVVKNILNLRNAYEALAQRGYGVEGMGLVYGSAGFGKSTALTWLRTQTNAVYVRACATWTPTAMLKAIAVELGFEPHYRAIDNVHEIVRQLATTNRGLYVDELDYLVGTDYLVKALDTLRDIHDISKMPVLLIGMAGIERKLKSRLQLARRITQWVEFLPADLDDARLLARDVCEVQLDDELLADLHGAAKGNIGLMSNGLARIEQFGKANGKGGPKSPITREVWGARPFFLGQPA
ncbi:MAG: putative prophage MuSo1, transposition protein [bacterium]|nr:putative prophage MuSo1, transposition protein [bacterium]